MKLSLIVAIAPAVLKLVDAGGKLDLSSVPRRTTTAPPHCAGTSCARASSSSKQSLILKEEKDGIQAVSPSTTTAVQSPRGGATGLMDRHLTQSLVGVGFLAAIEYVMKQVLKANKIDFPPMLAGCVALFTFLLLWDMVISSASAQSMAEYLAPGAALLAKWLPMFFVPGLALLPLAPSVGGNLELFKVVMVAVVGLIYSILTVGATAMAFLGKGSPTIQPPEQLGRKRFRFPSSSSPIKKVRVFPFSEKQAQSFGIAAIVMGVLAVLTAKNGHSLAKPCETSFLTLFTVAAYMSVTRLPASFVEAVHPLVTTGCLILLMVKGLGILTNRSFHSILKSYKVGSLDFKAAGSGDVLLYLLGPSAVSFAISMFSKRDLLLNNLLVILAAVLVSSAGGLFGTAAFVRLIQLGGKSIATARTLRLSVLPRNVTTALALAFTSMVGGDLPLCAAVVCLTGILGATYGKNILKSLGISDPITRGLCIGSSAQGLGVSSMADEPDAFPFAAMAMILTAITSTTMVTFPSVKQALIKLATGSKI